ncbi:UNVERIFIED_CONTAM: Transcription factor EGL1, partial [Sesamum angustifolium]
SAAEVNADQLGLQRSDQLRELYESLSLGETSPQAKRPTAALSPEDLTDAEWYFLVCMSFVFNVDQGLPGRTLAKNQTSGYAMLTVRTPKSSRGLCLQRQVQDLLFENIIFT